jgi:hypothetical protein
MAPPPPDSRAPPAALPDEPVEEILLRVPPDDPASLARAALACRRWRGLVADQAFRRRRLALHGAAPPLLGFLCDAVTSVRFVPTSSFLPARAFHPGRRVFDARHGRVLLHGHEYYEFAVWNPITDQLVELPKPPIFLETSSMKATVLCAATGACDHLDCHRGPFVVVMVGTNDDFEDVDIGGSDCDYDSVVLDEFDESEKADILHSGFRRVPKDMFACVYSSESGEWSEPTYAEHPGDVVGWERSALVGNKLYFVLQKHDRILEYDLSTQEMSMIRMPYVRTEMIFTDFVEFELTAMEDGRLGFARVEKSNELCLWSREEGYEVARDQNSEVTGWALCKIIDLKKLFPLVDSITLDHCLVGFVEGVCVALVAIRNGLFSIDMKSGLIRKVFEGRLISCAVPYITFCTPGTGLLAWTPCGNMFSVIVLCLFICAVVICKLYLLS